MTLLRRRRYFLLIIISSMCQNFLKVQLQIANDLFQDHILPHFYHDLCTPCSRSEERSEANWMLRKSHQTTLNQQFPTFLQKLVFLCNLQGGSPYESHSHDSNRRSNFPVTIVSETEGFSSAAWPSFDSASA